jgi:DNA polymerase kappa
VQVSEQLLSAFGVNTVGDLQRKRAMVSYLFSPISFDFFLHVSLGLGSTHHFAQEDEERKSVSCERTFAATSSKQEMEAKIQDMAERLHGELSELKLTGRCITLKLKQADFRVWQLH